MGDDCVNLGEDSTGQEALNQMRAKEQTEAYIISDSGNLLGKLSVHQAVTAGDKLQNNFATKIRSSSKDDSLQHAMYVVSDFVGESIPIVDGDNRVFLGAVTEGDLFSAVIEVQNKVRNQERG